MQNNQHANSASADEKYLQELSALLDGECREPDPILDHAASDSEGRLKWQSYHLIRDELQRERHSALPANFASIVSEKIAREESFTASSADVVPISQTRSRRRRSSRRAAANSGPAWLPFAGLGLAASVAAAGFVGWQVLQNFDASTTAPTALTVAGITESAPDFSQDQSLESGLVRAVYRGNTGTRWVAASGQQDSKVEQRLNSLLLNHLEDSTMGRVQGMVAHTRLAGYDTETSDASF